MKVAILSINLHTKMLNYGAVLHSWVFQKLMRRRGDVELCEIIDYIPLWLENSSMLLRPLFGRSLKQPNKLLRALLNTPGHMLRYARFERFIKNRLTVTRGYTHKQLNEAKLSYDVIFFESDVIWEPSYFGNRFDPAFFGAMDSMKSMRRIAYSASMGDADLTDEQKEECRALLKTVDCISMRETYASEVIRTLTDTPVADVVDPVLLADPTDFDEITSERIVKEDYILVYFPVHPDKFTLNCAHKCAKEHGLKVVEVSCQSTHALHNTTYTSAGIEDFLSLVRNASMIYCNSLHGACLSLLFHKDFYAFYRHRGEKYRNLLQKFALGDRFIERGHFVEAGPIDWQNVDALRAVYRAESLEWIDRAMNARQGQGDA